MFDFLNPMSGRSRVANALGGAQPATASGPNVDWSQISHGISNSNLPFAGSLSQLPQAFSGMLGNAFKNWNPWANARNSYRPPSGPVPMQRTYDAQGWAHIGRPQPTRPAQTVGTPAGANSGNTYRL